MTSKRKTSEVWTYFSVDQDTPVFAQCLLCDMRLKRGKENDRVSWSVSPLWNHLKRNHPEEHSRASDQRSAVERSTKQRKVEEAKKNRYQSLRDDPRFICYDGICFNLAMLPLLNYQSYKITFSFTIMISLLSIPFPE